MSIYLDEMHNTGYACNRSRIMSTFWPHPTLRSARAVVATAWANGIILSNGVILPRLLVLSGTEYLIENGCADALLKSGMMKLVKPTNTPRDEQLSLTAMGFDYVRGEFGDTKFIALGVLDP